MNSDARENISPLSSALRVPISMLVSLWTYSLTTESSVDRPPLWSSGQSSWLQIRRPGFDSRHYQKKSNWSGTGSTQPREYN
jgi:hypothetical protein